LATNPDCCALLLFIKDLMNTSFMGANGSGSWINWGWNGTMPEPDLRDFNDRGKGSGSKPTNNKELDDLIKKHCGKDCNRRKSRHSAPILDEYRKRIKEYEEMPKIRSIPYRHGSGTSSDQKSEDADNAAIRHDDAYRRWWEIQRRASKEYAERERLQRELRMRYPNNTITPPLRPMPQVPANRR
jgi:hypothetical protein